MHQRKSKKIFFYLFLFIFVCSINNIKINNLKFITIEKVNIFGLNELNKDILLENLKNLYSENIFFIDSNELKKRINSNNFIENYQIFKQYPSTLNIIIKKTKILAKIKREKKNYFIGSNGKFIEYFFLDKHIPFIFGNPDINEILKLKKIIDQSKLSYDLIKNLYYFPSKRWDIELKDNKIIKLSKNKVNKNLKEVYEFLQNKDFENIKLYDFRVKNQIILND